MHIYIDEAGNFIPGVGSKISCGAALVVPDSKAPDLFKYFARLVDRWDSANNGKEVKGSALDEVQMASVIHLATHYNVVLVICAIDAGNHADDEIRKLVAEQGHKITSGLTEQHHPHLVAQLKEIRINWEKLSSQLAIQAYTFFALAESVLRDATLYFVQREPATLGALDWVIDAKEPAKITNYEEVWHQMLMPYLQTTFLKEPLGAIEGADYSAWDAMVFTDDFPQSYASLLADEAKANDGFFDLRRIMAKVSFDPTSPPGLRLVDMLASAFRRAVAGTLQPHGWEPLGRLLICQQNIVRLLALRPDQGPPIPMQNEQVARVLDVLKRRCKPMLAAR